ncbi:MAG: hypothetical protein V2B18_15525 [Pseudomonadota bacterium]
MKKIATLTLALTMAIGLAGWSAAQETDFDDLYAFDRSLPGWKFGRGVVNLLSGPYELLTNMTNEAIKGAYKGAYSEGLHGYVAGSTNGMIAGMGSGLYYGMKRMTTGALEILTFWKPEYGPTMDPEYGTRARAFGHQDYFDPDPFWYNGPAR